jgi:putative transposase
MALHNYNINLAQLLLKFLNAQDPMHEMLQWLCTQMMEAEVESKLKAEKSERTSSRQGYRSGYRVRRFDTRMGTVYLMVPKVRKGGYVPFFVSARKRSETALMSVIQEAYVNGVSTRKIERLAKELGIESISSGQVSVMTKELNEKVEAFRTRPLTRACPILWVDALYEKVRVNGFVRNIAVLVVIGLDGEGRRDILAVEPMLRESDSTYTNLFESLKKRGLKNP